MDIKDFAKKLSPAAYDYGFTDWEIYYNKGESFEVRTFKGECQYKNTSLAGLSFRGTYKNQMGYAFTEKIDETVIDQLIKNACDNACIIQDKDVEFLYKQSPKYHGMAPYNPAIDKYSPKDKTKLVLDLEQAAYATDERVVSVDYCVLGNGYGETCIINSYGLSCYEKSNMGYAYVSVRVNEGTDIKIGTEIWHGMDFKELCPSDLAKKAADTALAQLGAITIKSSPMAVIFDNKVSVQFLASFASVFYGERVQKGFSLLKDKIGEPIASSVVTMVDQGECEESLGTVGFDSEGVPTTSKKVIENGVLKTYLHNLKSAKKDGVSPTGNGFKPGYLGTISTACTNMYILPASGSKADLLKNMGNGILISSITGLHAGVSAVSGDFSLSASGFLVENGEITKAVDQITIAGNFYKTLKDIQQVGNDLRFDIPSPMGTIGSPSLLIKSLNISGV